MVLVTASGESVKVELVGAVFTVGLVYDAATVKLTVPYDIAND
jgi:hypothetical protein